MWAGWWWWAVFVGGVGGRHLATPHPIIQNLRDTPASPRPSLRSQLRAAAMDPRGRPGLHIENDICSNTLANVDPRRENDDVQEVVDFLFNGQPPPSQNIVVMVEIANYAAMAFLNGVPVELYSSTDLGTTDGVVIVVVVHPSTGRAIRQYRLSSHASAQPLQAAMASLQQGRLLLITGTVVEVDPSIRSWLSDMGVTIPLSSASSRVAWAWAGVVGGATLGQVGGIIRPWNQPRLYLELYLPRAPDTPWCPGAPKPTAEGGRRWVARAELCRLYDGYGSWCSCSSGGGFEPQARLELTEETIAGLRDAVMVVLASRPEALHRLLMSVMMWADVPSWSILVFTNDPSHELLKVCESHGVELQVTGRSSDCLDLHVTRLYESALTAALILKPRATFFLTLEDDMEVLPTFYRWMSAGRRVVEGSERWVCVNSIRRDQPQATHPTSHPVLHYRHSLTEKLNSTKLIKISPDPTRSKSSEDIKEMEAANAQSKSINNVGKTGQRIGIGTSILTGNSVERSPVEKVDEKSLEELVVGRFGSGSEGRGTGEEDLEVEEAGWRLAAGWGAERRVLEAMIRFWPLATRDVDWRTLLDYWAGSSPCLTPVRSHARHAHASHSALGVDLLPLV